MGFQWDTKEQTKMYISDKRWCLTKEGQLVEDGHPDAATLLVGVGGTLDTETAIKHGLMPSPEPNQIDLDEVPGHKSVQGPPEDKAIKTAPSTKKHPKATK